MQLNGLNFMKVKIHLLFFLISYLSYPQNVNNSKDWRQINFSQELIVHQISKNNTSFSIKNLKFEITWNEKMYYSKNTKSYYGGISKMEIYQNGKRIQTLKNIKDYIGLGYIDLRFFDFNMDGHIDFTIPLDSGRSVGESYYLFDPKQHKFIHQKDWDYLKIWSFNPNKKLITTRSYDNCCIYDEYTYKVNGLILEKINHEHFESAPQDD